jgi:hypothetical protein
MRLRRVGMHFRFFRFVLFEMMGRFTVVMCGGFVL